ncbi:RNA polymerase sigma-70 factor [Bacteroides sedimenti]|uniref:DNA-directed RNA polymerase sigma-70 factor n=1 Tax=Bacteroides sedimenti TaxID=2136147 RepID=A0ABN6Z1C9_9BACE
MGNNLSENIKSVIVELAVKDSQMALRSLYMTYYGKLMRFATLQVGVATVAEEIVSDTFMVVWENRSNLTDIANLDAYLYTIVRNKCISYLRTQHISTVDIDETQVDLFTQTETTPEMELISKESISRLNNAINSLPHKCKLSFKLIREDKMKYKEAAELMGISVKTLEAHITTAVKKLRETLSGDMND